MMNILNGGAHADNPIDFQEFMIMPVGADSFAEALRWAPRSSTRSRSALHEQRASTAVGDEGGFAPNLASARDALDFIMAIDRARPAISPARRRARARSAPRPSSSERRLSPGRRGPRRSTPEEMARFLAELAEAIRSVRSRTAWPRTIWSGWKALTDALGDRVQLVGDDLFVTNPKRLGEGIARDSPIRILVKVNQIGTLTRDARRGGAWRIAPATPR